MTFDGEMEERRLAEGNCNMYNRATGANKRFTTPNWH